MLPIIDFETIDMAGDDARFLKIAAAVPGARGADTLDKPDVQRNLLKGPDLDAQNAAELAIDVVFVIDTTISMQPYIDSTKNAVTKLVRQLQQRYKRELDAKISFGLVGFRDDVRVTPDLEYTTRNFTPELVTADELINLLEHEAKEADSSSKGWAEEVFAGVSEAIEGIHWRPDALKIMVLISDASSHPYGHVQNTTGKEADILRNDAKTKQIHRCNH